MVSMNYLKPDKQALILRCLVDGSSIRAASRIAGVSKNTVLKLLVDAGAACSEYQDRNLRQLDCKRIEVDEIWSFVYAKARNVRRAENAPREAGDVWTWTAFDPDSKLVPSWLVGDRSVECAYDIMFDLRKRLNNRIQLTTDAHTAYKEAVATTFRGDVDYAQLTKIFGPKDEQTGRKYCIGSEMRTIEGKPNLDHASTSGVERNNLTIRMNVRRFGRRTNAFSKKVENHAAALSLHFFHYNYCRRHRSLDTTPAVAAGVVCRRRRVKDIVRLVQAHRPKPGPRGQYKKRQISN